MEDEMEGLGIGRSWGGGRGSVVFCCVCVWKSVSWLDLNV